MKMVKFLKYHLLGKSVKEIELNSILDKISKKLNLTDREKNFLELYNSTNFDERDYVYLSKNTVFNKIKDLLDKNKIVICDLHDRDGKIGLRIKKIENEFSDESCNILLSNGSSHSLHDRYLYNLIHNSKKGEYSLQIQDEYFEKISSFSNED